MMLAFLLMLMVLTFTNKSKSPHSLGSLVGMRVHDDVTEYAAGGWAPSARPAGTVVGIVVLWQENADFVLRWDRTNKKVKAFVMSTGLEAGAVDIGEFDYVLVAETE